VLRNGWKDEEGEREGPNRMKHRSHRSYTHPSGGDNPTGVMVLIANLLYCMGEGRRGLSIPMLPSCKDKRKKEETYGHRWATLLESKYHRPGSSGWLFRPDRIRPCSNRSHDSRMRGIRLRVARWLCRSAHCKIELGRKDFKHVSIEIIDQDRPPNKKEAV
jgi:hypothetical protein